jgi:hypothetical protein
MAALWRRHRLPQMRAGAALSAADRGPGYVHM